MIEVPDEMREAFQVAAGWPGPPWKFGPDVAKGLAAALALFVRQVEGTRGSGLCDCDDVDSDPTNAATGAVMDHHCDCRSVVTAAMLLGAYSETVHAEQCGHGTAFDEFYGRRQPPAPAGRPRLGLDDQGDCEACNHLVVSHRDDGCHAELRTSTGLQPCPCQLARWQVAGDTSPYVEGGGDRA